MLQAVADGSMSVDDARSEILRFDYEDIGFARIDHGREKRLGFPEVVYAERKTTEEVVEIAGRVLERSGRVLVTRLVPEQQDALEKAFAGGKERVHSNRKARTLRAGETVTREARVVLLTAGTSDIPVAEEAKETLLALGIEPHTAYDAGVAGIHRLLGEKEALEEADAAIVVAGMEGALASVVGGLARCPVIAVPTSVGYGASFGGVSALLAMLNSCSPNVVTVNIDNGFGAAFFAGLIVAGKGTK